MRKRVLLRVGWGLALLAVVWLSGGCRLFARTPPAADAGEAFDELLPAGWTRLGSPRAVNLNAADVDANLLLFRFDQGQVGAAIVEGPAAAPTRVEWLLPRTFGVNPYLGQGMIAPPDVDAAEIYVDLVEARDRDNLAHQRELVIRGGTTHLTFVWWEEGARRYGVTQLVAPGGFGGVDWDAWQAGPKVIATLSARTPLTDYRARSQICQETVYVRRTDLPGVAFDERPVGLMFCRGEVPTQPFYAEGVALAYLLWPRPADDGLTALLAPGATLLQLDAEVAYDRLVVERIVDVHAYVSVPVANGAAAAEAGSITTPVCVELAERANPSVRRWVVLTLRYLPSAGPTYLPGRWTVGSARTEPPPPTAPAAGYCAAVLARSAP